MATTRSGMELEMTTSDQDRQMEGLIQNPAWNAMLSSFTLFFKREREALDKLKGYEERKAAEQRLVLDTAMQELRVVVPATTVGWFGWIFGDDESLRSFGVRFLELAPEALAMLARTEKRLYSVLKPLCGVVLNEICFPNLLDLALARNDTGTARRLLEEAMDRLGRNLSKIYDRLKARGYQFDDPVPFIAQNEGWQFELPPGLPVPERIPLVLDILWRRLGGINFTGQNNSHKTWFPGVGGAVGATVDDIATAERRFATHCSDVLRIDPPQYWSDEEGQAIMPLDPLEESGTFISLAPDTSDKDQIPIPGGGPRDGVQHPSDLLDPYFGATYRDKHWHQRMAEYHQAHPKRTSPFVTLQHPRPPTLLNYLRWSVLDGAGFPGFLHPSSCPDSLDPLRRDLTADLEAF